LPLLPRRVRRLEDDIIIRRIDQAAGEADFVVVDLEGRATGLAGYAIAISDFVIIPVRGSNPDAKQAFRHMGLLKTQERLTKRAIPFAMLFTQTSPALRPRTQRFIEQRLADEGAPVFETQLIDREAYRAMLSFGGTVAGLAGKGVSGLPPRSPTPTPSSTSCWPGSATATSRSKGRGSPDD
jgi:chromosome partitioning protein